MASSKLAIGGGAWIINININHIFADRLDKNQLLRGPIASRPAYPTKILGAIHPPTYDALLAIHASLLIVDVTIIVSKIFVY